MVKTSTDAVFADTSAWYALFVSTDPCHERAVASYERLKGSLTQLVVSDWVVVETEALLHRRLGAQAAKAVLAALRGTPQIRVVWMDEESGRAAMDRYREGPGGLSLVDAGSFVVMDSLGLRRAFAFDEDFQGQGYEVA